MLQNNSVKTENKSGVSPVIGVILMVAITVILAAVIGAFVLGFSSQLQQEASAVVTFDETDEVVTVRLVSVGQADFIYVTSDPGSKLINGVEQGTYWENGPNGEMYLLNETAGGAGEITQASPGHGYVEGGTLTVKGVLDGRETVLQTYEMGSN
jgi:flagellin-like protein